MDFDLIYKALANPVWRQILLWLKTPQQYFAHQAHPLDFGRTQRRKGLIVARMQLTTIRFSRLGLPVLGRHILIHLNLSRRKAGGPIEPHQQGIETDP